MNLSENYSVNGSGHFIIEECDSVEIAKEYGTPLYVMSEAELRGNIRGILGAVREEFGSESSVAYASKALACKEIYRIVKDEGMSLDVVSEGELYTALSVGFPAKKIYFHGSNKSVRELIYAIESKVGRIVVDNFEELKMIGDISRSKNACSRVLLRVTPGVEAHTHSYVVTGAEDSKFGFSIVSKDIQDAVEYAKNSNSVQISGLHCHIGSQITETAPFCETAKIMTELFISLNKNLNAGFKELNLGGGFGIPYKVGDCFPEPSEIISEIADVVKKCCGDAGVGLPKITFEPGRSVAGSAGVTLYSVGSIKHIEKIRTYLSVDGGMTDNPRYMLYSSDYTALVANRGDKPCDFTVTIAGRCCESGDLIQENTVIQCAERGDILAVLSTGAYNYSMSSNYNRIPRPAMVMVSGKESRVIIKRETLEDIVRNDI